MVDNKEFFVNIDGQRIPVTEEVYLVYYRSKRRMRYYERDIKTESAVQDKYGNITMYKPAKEDSLERLIATGADFPDEQDSVEDAVIRKLMLDKLHDALIELTEDERKLIEALFYEGKTERQAAAIFGISQKGINKRKTKILEKLKKRLKTKIAGTQTTPANGKRVKGLLFLHCSLTNTVRFGRSYRNNRVR